MKDIRRYSETHDWDFQGNNFGCHDPIFSIEKLFYLFYLSYPNTHLLCNLSTPKLSWASLSVCAPSEPVDIPLCVSSFEPREMRTLAEMHMALTPRLVPICLTFISQRGTWTLLSTWITETKVSTPSIKRTFDFI